jgi:hypothetical protein
LADAVEKGFFWSNLLRGCLTEKIAGKNRRTLSHEHTIFRDAIFPDACARTWWEIGGGKKNHAMGSGDGQLCETPCPPKRCGLSRLAQGKLILAASTFSMVKDALGSMQWNVDHCPVAMQLKKPEGRLCSTRSSGSFCSRLRSATNGCRGMHSRNANPQVPSPGRAARFRATP